VASSLWEGDSMADKLVLTEAEAVEILALLITSARTQMDEPAHYGPLRLLTATERLSGMVIERSSDKSKSFLQDAIDKIPDMHMSMSDVENYTASLDDLSREVAKCLLLHSDIKDG
jgi:hypothetical protein